jgi:hypothetical protein
MEKRNLSINLDTATRWYNSTDKELKALALETFPELGIKPLPKTWEKLDEINGFYIDNSSSIELAGECCTSDPDHKNVFATKEQAEAAIALAQLSQLLKVYRNNWVPNWEDSKRKYCIYFESNLIVTNYFVAMNYFLSFQDEETRDLFLENFRDLIEKAKPLIS